MTIRDRLAAVIATWFGCGYSPKAPGTVGSAAAIGIAILIAHYAGWPPMAFAALAAVVSVPGIWAAGETARLANIKDPQFVVVDEVPANGWRWPARAHSIGKRGWRPSSCSACSISGSPRPCDNWNRCPEAWALWPTT